MGINPPSDIVHDVARAADPMRYQAAANRLSQIAGASNPGEFAEAFKAAAGLSSSHLPPDTYAARTIIRSDALNGPGKSKAAYEKFEAFVLQTFIESMMPKDADSVFGKGTAGSIWKSMMAEQIGTQISRTGGIGIAKRVFAAHPPAESIHPGVTTDRRAEAL
ncbi:rod-binding protein [Microvirga flavescens]|uniref:rod-binding protein n=1 Tax=Microvirga flavescens TaxID=2249811 RepID=UPI000DD4F6A9|nr:rod-binding protein [Microvirga flavescens]